MKFETRFTRDFIKRSLPAGVRRVLEIGCGSGELAASLLQDGVSLIAIDNDADSIAAAQRLGVDARIAAWPDFEDGQFDAVLFTRSLHHMHPLDRYVQPGTASGRRVAGCHVGEHPAGRRHAHRRESHPVLTRQPGGCDCHRSSQK